MKTLGGKIALVTGGAKNVGRVIARELARRGARVIINYFHSHDAAKRTQAEWAAEGLVVDLVRASVAQRPQVERMFKEIEQKYGGLDVLVNNAASGALLPGAQVDEEALDRALGTNLKGSLWCSRAAAPLMAGRAGGAIVNISTLGGGQLVMANYLACGPAKAAVESLTRYLAVEYAPLGVRVNTAASGMLTSEVADAFPRAAEMQRTIVEATPLGRLGRPEDLAAVVAFLASDDARWITGQMVLADGGLSLGSALLSPRTLPVELRSALTELPATIGGVAGVATAELPATIGGVGTAELPATIGGVATAELPATRAPVRPAPAPSSAPEAWPTAAGGPDDIVVVGMGLAIPGANDPEQYWDLLMDGPHRFVQVPADRWDYRSFFSEGRSAEDKTYQSVSAFITGFRPEEGSQREGAPDEQEHTTRWLRHSLVQALRGVKVRGDERWSVTVGYTPDGSHHLEEASVLAGTLHHLEGALESSALPESARRTVREHATKVLRDRYRRGAGRSSEFLPHRVGRNAVAGILPRDTEVQMVDTACSSSLYAVDIGVKALLMGKSDVSVCGGAFALGPLGAILFAKLNGLSTGGVVRALDGHSDGVLFADGAGVVVLKRRSRAVADGDSILAVLDAFGGSSDGKGKAIYAPSSAGQALAIRRAFAKRPHLVGEVDWVVAHATGTPAGDLAEFTSLREVLATDRTVFVTSNKSVIGHTGWAAGVVSLIQVVLAMRKGTIPPQHNFTAPPDDFGMDGTKLAIPVAPVPWGPKPGRRARVACVSGFGFGGTNAHLVVSEDVLGSGVEARPLETPVAPAAPVERAAVVAWSAHVPGLKDRAQVTSWLTGEGPGPGLGWGEAYPVPPFEQIRMPPTSAKAIDRTQLMILACAHQLRAELGGFWERARASTGVFVGHMGPTRSAVLYGGRCYMDDVQTALAQSDQLQPVEGLDAVLPDCLARVRGQTPPSNENSFPGMMPNIIPARVANFFNLQGPNMTLDTGFSSALTACEIGARYLRSGDIDLALVGGINGNTTPAMRALFERCAPSARAALAEGAFMFALVRESTAREAGLPVLAFLDGERADAARGHGERVGGDRGEGERVGGERVEGARVASQPAPAIRCGLHDGDSGANYLGAEGALALLRALCTHAAGRDGRAVQVICHDDSGGAATTVRLSSPSAAGAASDRAPAVGPAAGPASSPSPSTLELTRQVAKLEELPLERVHPPRPLIPPGAVVLTNRAELVAALGELPAGATVLCTAPLPAGPSTRGVHHIAEITPAAVDAVLETIGGPPRDLRVISDLAASHDPDDLWGDSSRELVALHDLAFLVLQRGFARMTDADGSFVTLLIGAMKRGGLHPWSGLFGGLTKTARLELPACRVFAVVSATTELARGLAQAEEEWTAEHLLPVVVYDEAGRRLTTRLREEPGEIPAGAAPPLDDTSVVVATAGARGITAELVKALAERFRPHLYIIGSNRLDQFAPGVFEGSDEDFARRRAQHLLRERAAHPDKTVAQANREFDRMLEARSARRNLDEMARHSGAGKVRYIACDVLDRKGLDAALADIVARHGRVDLLINAAGLNRSAAIPVKALAAFRSVRDIKLEGYRNLKYALRRCPPRLWCNFGSFIGLTGQLGEADYASANDFLATAASYARVAHGADEFTVGWTLWKSVGLGANPVTRAFLEKSGIFSSMSTEEGVHHFLHELGLARRDACVLPLGQPEKKAILGYIPKFFSDSPRPPRASRAAEQGFYLGPILARSAGEVVFERVFDLQRDDYLAHHVVNGHPTLPGTFMTEIATEAASFLFPKLRVVAVEDLAFHRFLRVYANRPSPKRIRARILRASDEEASVEVAVLTDLHSPGGHVLARDKVHFECKVLLRDRAPSPLRWEAWDPAEESPVPDPYHFPSSPVLLTGPFVSTTATRLHPFGKRATCRLAVSSDHPAFSSFLTPTILLDGLARALVLNPVNGGYLPLAAPLSIGRIDLHEQVNDCALAQSKDGPIELYVTPRDLPWGGSGAAGSHHVAVRADGTILLQMKRVNGAVFGYVHQDTGAYVSADEMNALVDREPARSRAGSPPGRRIDAAG
jgi:NAD(P)-dependent dehydrogenase (short-subunit alcohol dehydrogenase family)/3-oxoacyl-(acyl-carrier-protein) synthase